MEAGQKRDLMETILCWAEDMEVQVDPGQAMELAERVEYLLG